MRLDRACWRLRLATRCVVRLGTSLEAGRTGALRVRDSGGHEKRPRQHHVFWNTRQYSCRIGTSGMGP